MHDLAPTRWTRAAACAGLAVSLPLGLALAQAPLEPLETLGGPGAQTGDRVGEVLEMGATWLVAGRPAHDAPVTESGDVIVWPRVGSTFGAPATLASSTPNSNGQFGAAVALDGDELCVAELRSTAVGAPARGAVHRYRWSAGAWAFVDRVVNPGTGSTNAFGTDCARDGDLLVVGAPNEPVMFAPRGAAYVFRLVGGVWQQEALLVASDGTSGDQFGKTVAVAGERILVGAPNRFEQGAQTGAAYAFERVGGVWSEAARFQGDPGANDRALGTAVDLDGVTAVIGAARTNDRGATYVFVDSGATWQREARLRPTNLGTFATFGSSVALRGDDLVVGAYQDTAAGNLTGAAWVFRRVGTTWSPVVRLVGAEATPAFHGRGVALDGAGAYVVGEPIRSLVGGPTGTGVLHHYRPDPLLGAPYCSPVANSTQRTSGIAALGSALVATNDVTLLAYDLPNQAFGFFLASRTQGAVNQPGGSQGVLCLSGAIGRYVGPGQIRNSGTRGLFSLALDLAATPTPTGLVSIASGETWNFQAWHRDNVSGAATSNFTGAVAVQFL